MKQMTGATPWTVKDLDGMPTILIKLCLVVVEPSRFWRNTPISNFSIRIFKSERGSCKAANQNAHWME
jgi:hypothetical protein